MIRNINDYIGLIIVTWIYALFSLPIKAIPTIVVSVIALLLIRCGKLKFSKCGYFVYYISFLIICGASTLWAINRRLAVLETEAQIRTFILIFIVSLYMSKADTTLLMIKAIYYGGYIVSAYFIMHYGIEGIYGMSRMSLRMDSNLINANIFGMCLAFSVVAGTYLGAFYRWDILKIGLLGEVFLITISASRKSLVALVLGVLMVYAFKNWNNKKKIKSMLKVLLSFCVIAVIMYYIFRLPMFEKIMIRMERMVSGLIGGDNADISTKSRLSYVMVGIKIFKEHPLIGIGLDNAQIINAQINGGSMKYLHNNYIELLADLGILGLGAFYSIYLYCGRWFIKNKRMIRTESFFCLILLIISLVLHFGFVAYCERSTYFYSLLIFTEINYLKDGMKNAKRV